MSLLSNRLYKVVAGAKKVNDLQSRLATVTAIKDGKIYLTFYGEEEMSQKPYKRLDAYKPGVGDTVILQKVGNSYLIAGKVV